MDVNSPLSPSEEKRLDVFLSGCLGGMRPQEIRGFLAAIVSGPSLIPPSEWLDLVMGHPAYHSKERVQGALELLLRLYNQISDHLSSGGEIPPRDLSADDVQQWCAGYLKGARLDEQWGADQTAVMMLFPMAVLAGQLDLHGETDSKGNVIEDDAEHRARYQAELPEYVTGTYQYWLERRRAPPRRRK
jgi:uncharacterized protein